MIDSLMKFTGELGVSDGGPGGPELEDRLARKFALTGVSQEIGLLSRLGLDGRVRGGQTRKCSGT